MIDIDCMQEQSELGFVIVYLKPFNNSMKKLVSWSTKYNSKSKLLLNYITSCITLILFCIFLKSTKIMQRIQVPQTTTAIFNTQVEV